MGLLYKSFKLLNIILGECNFLPTILVEFIKVCAYLIRLYKYVFY